MPGVGIVHVDVTEHPTAACTAQQMIEAFPDDTVPQWLLRDRDAIYGDADDAIATNDATA